MMRLPHTAFAVFAMTLEFLVRSFWFFVRDNNVECNVSVKFSGVVKK